MVCFKSSDRLLHDSLPDLSQIKVFGSLCYASTLHILSLLVVQESLFSFGYAVGFKGSVLLDNPFLLR
jgi:hypothetical protein